MIARRNTAGKIISSWGSISSEDDLKMRTVLKKTILKEK